MQEVVTLTFCDIHFVEAAERVEGRRIHWMVNGKPWVLDVCSDHGLDIKLLEIDLFVEKYGHPEGAKAKPPKKTAAKKATGNGVHAPVPPAAGTKKRVRQSQAQPPIGKFHRTPGGLYVCDVQSGANICDFDTKTERGLKKHQTQSHPELAEQ